MTTRPMLQRDSGVQWDPPAAQSRRPYVGKLPGTKVSASGLPGQLPVGLIEIKTLRQQKTRDVRGFSVG